MMPAGTLDLSGRRDLRAVLPRRARQARRLPGPAAYRRVQDLQEHVHREGLHAGAPRDDAVAESRPVRPARHGHRGRPQASDAEVMQCDRRRSVSRGRAPGRRDSSTCVGYEDQIDDDAARAGHAAARERDVRDGADELARARHRARASRCSTPRATIAERRQLVRRPGQRRPRLRHVRRSGCARSASIRAFARSSCASTARADRPSRPK